MRGGRGSGLSNSGGSMAGDRETIGLTSAAQEVLNELEARGWFAEGQDIARFGLAYAIKAGVDAGNTSGTDTRWSAGNFDNTGEIRLFLRALYPDSETPVRLMEHLVNEGLGLIAGRLSEGIGPGELMEWGLARQGR